MANVSHIFSNAFRLAWRNRSAASAPLDVPSLDLTGFSLNTLETLALTSLDSDCATDSPLFAKSPANLALACCSRKSGWLFTWHNDITILLFDALFPFEADCRLSSLSSIPDPGDVVCDLELSHLVLDVLVVSTSAQLVHRPLADCGNRIRSAVRARGCCLGNTGAVGGGGLDLFCGVLN